MASRSPVSGTPLAKGSSAPDTPMSSTPVSPRAVPFPPPQTFDFLPQLHALILRLLSAQVSSDTTGAGAGPGGDVSGAATQPSSTGPGQSQQQQHLSAGTGTNNTNNGSSEGQHSAGAPAGSSAPVAAGIAALGPNAPPPLDVKDLPTEASAIKIRIQKARVVVEGLPDVGRTVEDQSREIEELDERIGRLRKVIGEFGRRAGGEKADKMKRLET